MNIRCTSLEELKKRVRLWDGEQVSLWYYPSGGGWKFKYQVNLGHRYSYYAYVDKTAEGVHPNTYNNLRNQEVHERVFGKSVGEVILGVLTLL